MKNKGLLIFLSIIGAVTILGMAVFLGFLWGRGPSFGCCQGFNRWGFNSMTGRGRGMFFGNSDSNVYGKEQVILSLEEAEDAVNDYLQNLDNLEELHIKEIMIFDNHAYAQIIEENTGIGAFEVLVDPESKYVSQEMGPNMMWNLKYGHMNRGMMNSGFQDIEEPMPISGEEAIQIANEYLIKNNSDLVASGHPDEFYGYYTIHTEKDGEIHGMLSVNGYNGQVFLHTWHGEFIEMSAHEDEH